MSAGVTSPQLAVAKFPYCTVVSSEGYQAVHALRQGQLQEGRRELFGQLAKEFQAISKTCEEIADIID